MRGVFVISKTGRYSNFAQSAFFISLFFKNLVTRYTVADFSVFPFSLPVPHFFGNLYCIFVTSVFVFFLFGYFP